MDIMQARNLVDALERARAAAISLASLAAPHSALDGLSASDLIVYFWGIEIDHDRFDSERYRALVARELQALLDSSPSTLQSRS